MMKHVTKEFIDLVLRLRRKFQMSGNERYQKILSNILWYSVPIVYPQYERDGKFVLNERQKMKMRKYRWFKYLKGMVNTFDTLYLVTLTFSEEHYNDTQRNTRHNWVKTYFSQFDDYYACLDIGKGGREHYHAIVAYKCASVEVVKKTPRKTFLRFTNPYYNDWKYGFKSVLQIKNDKISIWRSLSYAMKAAVYSAKSSKVEQGIRPFHKRGVQHFSLLQSDEELPF